jgi:hypothetical protein
MNAVRTFSRARRDAGANKPLYLGHPEFEGFAAIQDDQESKCAGSGHLNSDLSRSTRSDSSLTSHLPRGPRHKPDQLELEGPPDDGGELIVCAIRSGRFDPFAMWANNRCLRANRPSGVDVKRT